MMQRIWILAAPLLLVTGCSAERAEPVDKDAIAQAVKTDVQSIVDAFNARDADAALATDVVVMADVRGVESHLRCPSNASSQRRKVVL